MPEVNQQFGPYQILSELGKGAMGKVYLAKGPDGKIALKTILEEALAKAGDPEDVTRRFKRESKLAQKLIHENIVRTFDAGEADGTLYLACELVSGGDLQKVINNAAPLPEITALKYMRDVLRGLDYIHQNNFIHRDIKPENILMDENMTAKLTDLGLLRSTSQERTMMTAEGAIMGTPYYISPEQIEGRKDVDIRTDMYAVGCMLYQCLTAVPPFFGKTLLDILQKHLQDEAEEITTPGVRQEVKDFITKLIEKDRDDRYKDPAEALKVLDELMAGHIDEAKEEEKETKEIEAVGSSSLGCVKITDGTKTFFLYSGPSLRFGRASIKDDGDAVCLRYRPLKGNEDKTRRISSKHFNVSVKNGVAYVTDTSSTGTHFDDDMLVKNTPQELSGNHKIVVSEMQIEVIPAAVEEIAYKVSGKTVDSKNPGILVKRINNGADHCYALVPGVMGIALDDQGNLQIDNSASTKIVSIGTALGFYDGEKCHMLDENVEISFSGKNFKTSKIVTADQK